MAGTLITNLYGGPGTGKSTTAAGVFHYLKLRGTNCELVCEYAKDLVWEGSRHLLDNQIRVFAEQHHRIWRLLGKVDVIVTDSPILLSLVYYQGDNEHFRKMVVEEFKKLSNLNVFLERVKPFNPAGRLQTEEEARALDKGILKVLEALGESHYVIKANAGAAEDIGNLILENYLRAQDGPNAP